MNYIRYGLVTYPFHFHIVWSSLVQSGLNVHAFTFDSHSYTIVPAPTAQPPFRLKCLFLLLHYYTTLTLPSALTHYLQ
jgi:hypothetical protein